MAKTRITIRHEFPAVKAAAHDLVGEAREAWLETGQRTGEDKAESQGATRGYALQVGIAKERIGFQSARISAVTHSSKWGNDPWFLRLFEYGTVFIPAMPFIRPAARKANKVFVTMLGSQLEGKIRRRVGRVRR